MTIQQALSEARLSLVELHDLSGVSMNTLRSLSAGRNTNPQARTRVALSAALRTHASTLASLADALQAIEKVGAHDNG